MQAKKHKKLKKKPVNAENSASFYLDGEEEEIAYQAKRDLELCSFEEQFLDIELAGQERPVGRTKKLFQESIRTTASHKDQSRVSKRNVASRYLSFRDSPEKGKLEGRSLERTEKVNISKVRVGKCVTQYSFPDRSPGRITTSPAFTYRRGYQSPVLNKNFKSLTDRRIHHQNKSSKKSHALNSKNRFVFAIPYEEPQRKQKNYYSFNDTIENYDPFRFHTSRELAKERKPEVEDSNRGSGTARKEVSLRPQFMRLIKKIKQKEEANTKSHQKARVASRQN